MVEVLVIVFFLLTETAVLAWAFFSSCTILQPAGVIPGSRWWRRCVERPMIGQAPCVLELHRHTSLSVFLTCLLFFYSVPGRLESKGQLILFGIWAPAFSALRSQLCGGSRQAGKLSLPSSSLQCFPAPLFYVKQNYT